MKANVAPPFLTVLKPLWPKPEYINCSELVFIPTAPTEHKLSQSLDSNMNRHTSQSDREPSWVPSSPTISEISISDYLNASTRRPTRPPLSADEINRWGEFERLYKESVNELEWRGKSPTPDLERFQSPFGMNELQSMYVDQAPSLAKEDLPYVYRDEEEQEEEARQRKERSATPKPRPDPQLVKPHSPPSTPKRKPRLSTGNRTPTSRGKIWSDHEKKWVPHGAKLKAASFGSGSPVSPRRSERLASKYGQSSCSSLDAKD